MFEALSLKPRAYAGKLVETKFRIEFSISASQVQVWYGDLLASDTGVIERERHHVNVVPVDLTGIALFRLCRGREL